MWNFKKLPKTENEKVIEAVEYGDWRTLLRIHNKYELSDFLYCCGDIATPILKHFKNAIENGEITTTKTTTTKAKSSD